MEKLKSQLVVGILLKQPSLINKIRIGIADKFKKSNIELKIISQEKNNTLLQQVEGVEVLFAEPSMCYDILLDMPRTVKWMQCTWAGVEDLQSVLSSSTKQNFSPNYILTRMGDCFKEVMADYVVGAIVAQQRDFKSLYEAQKQKKWLTKEDTPAVFNYQPVKELTIGILGTGNIGLSIAQHLKGIGMKVHGLKRTDVSAEDMHKYPEIDRFYTPKNLNEFLSSCHCICNVLPSTPATVDMLSGNVLSVCTEKKPGFINVGRGDIINEESLVKALNSSWLSSAFLDVFSPEPLSQSSPLWEMKNVTITPHISGLMTDYDVAAKVFFNNLELYLKGKPLKFVYDWARGY